MESRTSPSVKRLIVQSAGIVMAAVLVSRVLGFLRDWTVAQQIGANRATDAYYAAFTLPDFINYLVAGGSLSLTFIPILARCIAEKREEDGWHVFSTVITVMDIFLIAGIILGEVFAPQLVLVIAPGFHGAERARVVFLTRLMLPAQFCFYQGGILSAVQYAKTKFAIPSFAPVVYNLGIILGGLLLARRIGITGFAVGVLVGATAGNFLLQIYGARRVGAKFSPNLDIRNPDFILFVKLSLPIMLALSIVFTDDWIIRWFASYLAPASITWLSFAKTLMRVPLGVLGQAVGVASFPFLAQLYSEGKFDELNRVLGATVKGVLLLLVPVSALTIAEKTPLVYFVYSHTRMNASDIRATAATLGMFSIAMFAWGAQNILARGFYAARDTLTPAIAGTAMAFLNLPVYWILSKHLQHIGLALASSIGVIAYAVILFVVLSRRTHSKEAGGILLFFFKICAAAAPAAVICFEVTRLIEARIRWQSTHGSFIVLVAGTAAGILATVAIAKLVRIREVDRYLGRLRFG
ncbi:MAG: murein biosynthesis integral membrane protein MurJ [Acidobacteriota bacterium]|nr:murein biosynthesis integral membrane protein MurJ [Acidobacteriota bacterium]